MPNIFAIRIFLDVWTRRVGRRQISSITLAGAHDRIAGFALCVPQLAARATATAVATARQRRKITPLPSNLIVKKRIRAAGSRATRDSSSRDEAKPLASVRPGDSKKMRPPHAPTSSHRPIGRVLGAGFDRRLLALRQVRARRLRPAGRLTCRVHGQIGRCAILHKKKYYTRTTWHQMRFLV